MSAQLAPPDPGWQRLRWERGTRYYEAVLHQDLWAGWILTRAWGAIGTARGRVVHTPCDSYAEAVAGLEAISRRRTQRGYHH